MLVLIVSPTNTNLGVTNVLVIWAYQDTMALEQMRVPVMMVVAAELMKIPNMINLVTVIM